MVAFPAECSKCNRVANAERFGCGWDDRYRGRGKVQHGWDPSLRTCPRWYLEALPDVGRVMYELEDYRRACLGPVGALPAPLVDCLRFADSAQRGWTDKAVSG